MKMKIKIKMKAGGGRFTLLRESVRACVRVHAPALSRVPSVFSLAHALRACVRARVHVCTCVCFCYVFVSNLCA